MPRRRPFWEAALPQWARELNQHIYPARIDLEDWIDGHPDEIAAFMRGFIRSDAPHIERWAEPVYRLAPRVRLTATTPQHVYYLRLTPEQKRQRAIIDDLPVEKQRLICAAGRLLWRTAASVHAHMVHGDKTGKALANAVAKDLIGEMLDLHEGPRIAVVRALVLMFVGEPPSTRQMQNYAQANPLRTSRPRR
jgi:hypothetical protein